MSSCKILKIYIVYVNQVYHWLELLPLHLEVLYGLIRLKMDTLFHSIVTLFNLFLFYVNLFQYLFNLLFWKLLIRFFCLLYIFQIIFSVMMMTDVLTPSTRGFIQVTSFFLSYQDSLWFCGRVTEWQQKLFSFSYPFLRFTKLVHLTHA